MIGRKLAEDRKIKVGDPLPLKDGVYPFNLNLTVRGIYDGPPNRDLRACYFHWDYLDEGLKKPGGAGAGNAGIDLRPVQGRGADGRSLARKIDEAYANSDTPTRTQTEEAFGQMFAEMAGDFQWIIVAIGLAVGISLLCVSANAMAMALRERTTEVAVLKAIGFGKPLVIALILAESVLIAGDRRPHRRDRHQALLRRRRPLEVHRRVPAVLLRPLVDGPAAGWSSRWRSGSSAGSSRRSGRRGSRSSTASGRWSDPHGPAQVQRPEPPGPLGQHADDRPRHRPDRLVVVRPVQPGRGAPAQPEASRATRST